MNAYYIAVWIITILFHPLRISRGLLKLGIEVKIKKWPVLLFYLFYDKKKRKKGKRFGVGSQMRAKRVLKWPQQSRTLFKIRNQSQRICIKVFQYFKSVTVSVFFIHGLNWHGWSNEMMSQTVLLFEMPTSLQFMMPTSSQTSNPLTEAWKREK